MNVSELHRVCDQGGQVDKIQRFNATCCFSKNFHPLSRSSEASTCSCRLSPQNIMHVTATIMASFFHLLFWPNISKLQTCPLNCLNSPAQISWFNIRSFVSIAGKGWQVSGILGEKNLAINFNSHTEPESQSESITAIINHFEKWQTHKHKDRGSMMMKFPPLVPVNHD